LRLSTSSSEKSAETLLGQPFVVLSPPNTLGRAGRIHAHLTFPAVIATALYGWRGLKVDKQRPRIIETYHAVGVAIPAWHRRLHAWMASKRDGLILMAIDDFWQTFVAGIHTFQPASSRMIGPASVANAERSCGRSLSGCRRIAGRWPTGVRQHRAARPRPPPELYVPIFAKVSEAFARDVHFLMAGEGELRQSIERKPQLPGSRIGCDCPDWL
jgi:hypothetical protein